MTPGEVAFVICVVGTLGLYLHACMVDQNRRVREERYSARIEAIEAECRKLQRKDARPKLKLIKGGKA